MKIKLLITSICLFLTSTCYAQVDTVISSQLQLNTTLDGTQFFSKLNDSILFTGYMLEYINFHSEESEEKPIEWIQRVEKGRVMDLTEFYRNGVRKLYHECNYKGSIPNGIYKEWYENGQLKTEGKYKKGKKIGKWKSWDEKGNVIKE